MATRALPGPEGEILPAAQVKAVALAALGDLFALVLPGVDGIPD